MRLQHIHFPGLTPYTKAAVLQQRLVTAHLAHKAAPGSAPAPPPPTIITAEFQPVYTCGRREIGSVTPEQIALLTSPTRHGRAEFQEALRGGQTTFHGPGQLVAYPILDLRRHRLGPRDYVCLLEKTVIRLCKERYGVATRTTEHPGVWVDDLHKICALGVHLRRHITSHGIGLNVTTDLGWFDRIVACGLEGKRTTSLSSEGVQDATVAEVGSAFVEMVAERLDGISSVERISPEDAEKQL